MDLTGKLIIKASLGDDIRRIPIHNEDITYDELILMMQRVFRDQLDASDDVTVKYKDEDGDLITLFDSADLAAAIMYSRVLKLTLFVNGKIRLVSGQATKPIGENVVKELRDIRNRINEILDSIGDSNKSGQVGSDSFIVPAKTNGVMEGLEEKVTNELKVESKEFDPLQKQHQQLSTPVPATTTMVQDDQQSVSSHTSSKNEPPTTGAVTVQPPPTAMANVQQPQRPTQQMPSYPQGYAYGVPPSADGGNAAAPHAPQGYPQYPQMPPAQPQMPPAQQPQVSQPSVSSSGTHPPAQQMSAFMGYPSPQQQQQHPQGQAPQQLPSVSSAPTQPYPGVRHPPAGPPMTNPMTNPYGMGGQRGPSPGGIYRYPQGPGYQ